MKKNLLAGILLAAGLCLSGCRAAGTYELCGTVNTEGSTSMADVMAVLQETFRERDYVRIHQIINGAGILSTRSPTTWSWRPPSGPAPWRG